MRDSIKVSTNLKFLTNKRLNPVIYVCMSLLSFDYKEHVFCKSIKYKTNKEHLREVFNFEKMGITEDMYNRAIKNLIKDKYIVDEGDMFYMPLRKERSVMVSKETLLRILNADTNKEEVDIKSILRVYLTLREIERCCHKNLDLCFFDIRMLTERLGYANTKYRKDAVRLAVNWLVESEILQYQEITKYRKTMNLIVYLKK